MRNAKRTPAIFSFFKGALSQNGTRPALPATFIAQQVVGAHDQSLSPLALNLLVLREPDRYMPTRQPKVTDDLKCQFARVVSQNPRRAGQSVKGGGRNK